MSINIKDVQKKLNELKSKSSGGGSSIPYWKPEEGDNLIRIVPYQHNEDWPFIDVYTHYKFSKLAKLKYFLTSPKTVGKPDPILEWAETLEQTGEKSDYELAKKFKPAHRVYVPIIVRGKEDEGVKFYGFGVTILESLLSIIDDPDWGDITALKDGRDITIKYTPKEKSSTNYAESKLLVKPKQTPAVTTKEHVELLRNQPNLVEELTINSYDELKSELTKLLSPDSSEELSSEDLDNKPKESEEKTSTQQKVSDLFDAKVPPSDEEDDSDSNDTSKDISDELNDLFK
jgi:hypothetical protein